MILKDLSRYAVSTFIVLFILTTSIYKLSAREFTDTKGRTIEAELVGVENETIALKLAHNGVIYHIGISELCETDRA